MSAQRRGMILIQGRLNIVGSAEAEMVELISRSGDAAFVQLRLGPLSIDPIVCPQIDSDAL
ncbi:hypothetical protein XI00_06335 [Bradyrhizobium sp. CCBAU 21359]|nr:hypothetical protein [Bradyrhizobium sp. CCBAU 21359]